MKIKNNVRTLREGQLMSKAELARRAGVSPLTITRIEGGYPCRMETKRKIILALGLKISDKDRVFVSEEIPSPSTHDEPSTSAPQPQSQVAHPRAIGEKAAGS